MLTLQSITLVEVKQNISVKAYSSYPDMLEEDCTLQ